MKKAGVFLFVLVSLFGFSQQTMMYTQYTFNKAGMNPAASGTDIDKEIYYTFGTNQQWVGFDNSPQQTFLNVSYTIRPPRSYKSWQNAGIYYDNDNSGLIGSSGIYGNYTYHRLLRKKLTLSFGVYVGARRYIRSQAGFDNNDPAVSRTRTALTLYPDVIPGIRLSDKSYFIGLSARQLSIFKLQDFKGRKMGSPSRLVPNVYFECGKMLPLSENLLMMPSLAVNTPFFSLPLVDANLMFYYASRIGLGAGIRNLSFLSGIFQIRFLGNMTAGFAYSYPINTTRFALTNSFEIMVGVVPVGMSAKLTGRHSVARCPVLDF